MKIKLINVRSLMGKRLLNIIMRTFIFLMCTTVFCLNTENSFSQENIIIEKDQLATANDVFRIIKRQTELNFVYPKGLFKNAPKIQLKKGEIKASKLIDKVLEKSNLNFKLTENNTIIINKSEKLEVIIQTSDVSGNIKGKDGQPLPGVNIIIEGTSTGTQSDFDGNYSIKAKNGDILSFSYIGFETQKVTIGDSTTINLIMIEETSSLDEVVVIGYGTQKRSNLTSAISSVDIKELENRPVNSITEMLSASVPGLNITVGSSAPNANPDINIRGFTGLNTSGAPLVIVDGVPLDNSDDIKYINAQDVESVSVLKDASATAVYGSRAPNGAILITTKSGTKGGKMKIEFSSDIRVSSPLGLPSSVSGSDYAIERNNRRFNSQTGGVGVPLYTDETIERILAYEAGELTTTGVIGANGRYGNVFTFNASENHIQEAFRDNVYNQSHNLSLSGGSDKTTYYASFNALDAQGVYQSDIDWLKRYVTNMRITTDINSWFTVGLNAKYSKEETLRPTIWRNGQNDQTFYDALGFIPTVPAYYDNGTANEFSIRPNLDGSSGSYSATTDVYTAQVTGEIRPFKGLKINGDYSWRTKNTFNLNTEFQFGGLDADGTPLPSRRSPNLNTITQASSNETYHTANFSVNYETSIKNHNINVLVGYNEEEYDFRQLTGYNSDFYTTEIPTLSTSFGDNFVADDRFYSWGVQGYFGRLLYNYKEKYLLNLSGRYDGTSRYAPDNRWAFSPSISAGYDIAKENFWPLKGVMNQFKLTAKYGRSSDQGRTDITSNSNLYTYLPTLGTTPIISTPINGSLPSAAYIPPILADDNTWAKPTNIGFGLDIAMFKNKLTMNYEWYQRTTYDQIGPAIQLPEVLGTAPPVQNNSVSETRGFEFNIEWRDQFDLKGDAFSYGIRAGLSDYVGYVVEYEDNETGTRGSWTPGQIFGELYGLSSAGIAQNQDEVLQNVLLAAGGNNFYHPGDLLFQDTNGDGLINSGVGNFWYTQGDRKRLGFTYPRYRYNVALNASWKGFSLAVLMQGVGHHKVYFANKFNFGTFNFLSEAALERGWWTADNTDAFFPRAYRVNTNQQRENTSNDQYENNLAHLRVKNVGLTYSFRGELLEKLSVSNASITLSGENLGMIFTKSWTPEYDPILIGTNSGRTYPPSRTFSLGFRVGL